MRCIGEAVILGSVWCLVLDGRRGGSAIALLCLLWLLLCGVLVCVDDWVASVLASRDQPCVTGAGGTTGATNDSVLIAAVRRCKASVVRSLRAVEQVGSAIELRFVKLIKADASKHTRTARKELRSVSSEQRDRQRQESRS